MAMAMEMERIERIERIKFWPCFEATGGWSKDMELFFEVRSDTDAWQGGACAMDFGQHSKQLIGGPLRRATTDVKATQPRTQYTTI